MRLPWRPVPPAMGAEPIDTSITEREARKLAALAIGRRVIEVGSGYGYSSIMMALNGAANVFSIDPHAGELGGSLEVMRGHIRYNEVGRRVFPIVGRSDDVLPWLIAAGARFDFAFIDGDHSAAAVERDFMYCRQLVGHQRGQVALHDYGEESCPGVKAAMDKFGSPATRLVDTLWVWR